MHKNYNIYILSILNITLNIELQYISWAADGQLKSHTKRCLEFENNAVDCMIFAAQPAGQLGPYYILSIYKY